MNDFVDTVRALRDRGEVFAADAPISIARAPGRLDLMGGNDDYTGGMVFEATIREATWAAAQRRIDRKIVLVNPQMREHGWQDRVELDLADLSDEQQVRELAGRGPEVRWTAYVLGVLHWLKQHDSLFPAGMSSGVTVWIQSDVPLNKGVSSSAAVEVSVMKAVSAAFGAAMEGTALAEACQWAENVIAQSACGIMDQIAIVLGDEDHILPLVCQACLPQPLVRMPEGLTYWGLDSGVRHQVSGIEYEAARAGGFMGYKLICDRQGIPVMPEPDAPIPRFTDPTYNGYLANLPPARYREFEPLLPETMTGSEYLRAAQVHVDPFTSVLPEHVYRVRACTRYAVEENQRVQLFAALVRGTREAYDEDAARLMGELMYLSHVAYTETGLGCKETDLLVELARQEGPQAGIHGAKITGGGGGGTVAILGRSDAEAALERIVANYRDQTGIDPYVFRGSSMGADRFGVVTLEPKR